MLIKARHGDQLICFGQAVYMEMLTLSAGCSWAHEEAR